MKTNKRKKSIAKFYVAIVVTFIIAGLGIGIKTMQKVKAFNEYEAKLAEYELYYTNIMVEYDQVPQEIFRELCNRYPDTCNYKVADWMFCVEYTNGIDLDTIVAATEVINPIIDKLDLIDDSYILDIVSKEKGEE